MEKGEKIVSSLGKDEIDYNQYKSKIDYDYAISIFFLVRIAQLNIESIKPTLKEALDHHAFDRFHNVSEEYMQKLVDRGRMSMLLRKHYSTVNDIKEVRYSIMGMAMRKMEDFYIN